MECELVLMDQCIKPREQSANNGDNCDISRSSPAITNIGSTTHDSTTTRNCSVPRNIDQLSKMNKLNHGNMSNNSNSNWQELSNCVSNTMDISQLKRPSLRDSLIHSLQRGRWDKLVQKMDDPIVEYIFLLLL